MPPVLIGNGFDVLISLLVAVLLFLIGMGKIKIGNVPSDVNTFSKKYGKFFIVLSIFSFLNAIVLIVKKFFNFNIF